LFSINYLFLIEQDLIDLPSQYAINIHGSLLPKYRGRTPHVWAIINGETKTGITAHLINEKVDDGHIVHQIKVPILPSDTGASMLEKFAIQYPKMIDKILNDIENNSLVITPQDTTKAVYFGKRTPEDGAINWAWNRERIYNWIRAQAKPYPGAFTFYEENKIIVHHAEMIDMGFHYQQTNGLILAQTATTICVKTTNGVLRLSEIETTETVLDSIQTGEIFNKKIFAAQRQPL